MHSPDGKEEVDFPSSASPPTGDPEPLPSESTPSPPKKRASRRGAKPQETGQQILLSQPISPIQGRDSPASETTSPEAIAATLSTPATASDRLSPLKIQKFKRRNRKRGSWLQRLIKKFELEPEDMKKLDRLDQFGSLFVRNALKFIVLLIGVILVCTFGIVAEKLRHESDILGKLEKLMGHNKLMTALISSASMFGTGAIANIAVSHVRKKRQEKSKIKNHSPESQEP